jgi:1,5-anhydro-D-fructose reductase (1,5-anhydro-D-mannitol-forming)
MRTVRWGILGCGDVCERKSGPAFAKEENSALVAVMRRDGAKAADYAKRHGVPRWYDHAEALVADPEVDAVYVATPPGSHLELALLAARAGKPAYVEKPMARTHAECLRMVEAFRSRGLPLYVAYYRRALPRFLKVKELLEWETVGRVEKVSIRLAKPPPPARPDGAPPWRMDPIQAGGGLFLDLASHTLDLLDFLLGPLLDVSGRAANVSGRHAVEDMVEAHFGFADGTRGIGHWDFASGREEDEVEIAGDKGRIVFATFADEPIRLETRMGTSRYAIPHPLHIQQPLIRTVVRNLNGVEPCPSTGDSAARTSLVMDAVLADFRRAREGESFQGIGRP